MATPSQRTLLDLVQAVTHFAKSDNEVVATVTYLVNSGKVLLCGNFAGAKIDRPFQDLSVLQGLRSVKQPPAVEKRLS